MSELATVLWMDQFSADKEGFFFVCKCGYESKRFAFYYEIHEGFQAHVRKYHGLFSRIKGAKRVLV